MLPDPFSLQLLQRVEEDAGFRVILSSDRLYERGLTLYATRPDKEWSLTDCISFVVMEDEGIGDAPTGDRISSRQDFGRCWGRFPAGLRLAFGNWGPRRFFYKDFLCGRQAP